MNLKDIAQEAHACAKAKGWYEVGEDGVADVDAVNVPEKLALIHSEISEALEEYRKGYFNGKMYFTESGKPEGYVVELADAVIRILDNCELLGLDIEEAIKVKLIFNRERPWRHGGKIA